MPKRSGGLRKSSVRFLNEDKNGRDDRGYDRDYGYGGHDDEAYDNGYDGYDYPCERIYPVGKLGPKRDHVDVLITPTNNAKYQTKVKWTPDSGAPKTMLSEKHFGWILAKNPDVAIRKSHMRFRPYMTGKIIPLIGECDMVLTNNKAKKVKTTVYIVEGGDESLLGKEDAIKLGIIRIDRDGVPENEETDEDTRLRCITPEVLKEKITNGIVSGDQTQDQIDAAME